MTSWIVPLLFVPISFLLGYGYVRGRRKNHAIASSVVRSLEEFYHPEEKRYTNIGGVIGYHIYYRLTGRIERLVGTLTLLPRHAVLYLPISRLLGRTDQLRLTLHTDAIPLGEGHIVEPEALSAGWIFIRDEESLHRQEVSCRGRPLVILSYNPLVAERLNRFLAALQTVEGLSAFTISRLERHYTLVVEPNRANLVELIRGLQDHLGLLEVERI